MLLSLCSFVSFKPRSRINKVVKASGGAVSVSAVAEERALFLALPPSGVDRGSVPPALSEGLLLFPPPGAGLHAGRGAALRRAAVGPGPGSTAAQLTAGPEREDGAAGRARRGGRRSGGRRRSWSGRRRGGSRVGAAERGGVRGHRGAGRPGPSGLGAGLKGRGGGGGRGPRAARCAAVPLCCRAGLSGLLPRCEPPACRCLPNVSLSGFLRGPQPRWVPAGTAVLVHRRCGHGVRWRNGVG